MTIHQLSHPSVHLRVHYSTSVLFALPAIISTPFSDPHHHPLLPPLHNGCISGYRVRARKYRLHKVRHLVLWTSSPSSSLRRYWGKRDTKLILPTNSSLSVTLDQDHLRSTTTSRADPSFDKDRLWLNGKEEPIEAGGRLATCISEMKRLRAKVEVLNPAAPEVRTPFSIRFRTA